MKAEKIRRNCIYSLQDCVWEVTLACCFSCRYCGSKGGKARGNELSTEECLDVAGQLADLGCERVSLIGGEVFMRPDWSAIVKALTDRDVRVSIITNGYVFSDTLISQLKEMDIESVAVSLDGPERVHDSCRQKGSFQRAVTAIDTLAESAIPVSVITTLHSQNVPYLDVFYGFLKSRPISAWQIQACSPMGNAAESGIDYHFDFSSVIRFVEENVHTSPFMMGIADNIGYFTETEGYLRGNLSGKAKFAGCRAGLTAIGIDSIGNVRGCESMYADCFIEGNVRKQPLRDIWESPDAFAYNRKFTTDLLTGKCAECRYGMICAGGCRSYNYFTHGRMYESQKCAIKFF